MHSDADFVDRLQEDPTDDTTRLVYADWLDEKGDPGSLLKAEFLRLTGELGTKGIRKGRKKGIRKRLQELAASLDTDWLAVVSQLAIENCQGKRQETEGRRVGMRLIRFDFLCDRQWQDLEPTEDHAVRFCANCQENVHYCDTSTEARNHAQEGHCIAVDLGVIRRQGDLEPERMWLGRPSPETLRQEKERVQPDPVSAERERRKQAAKRGGTGSTDQEEDHGTKE